MKQDDFKKIQADLNERINKNKEMVNSYFTKLKIFKKNSFEERFFSIFSYGSFIWFLSLVALGVLFSIGDINVITNFIPLDFLPWGVNSLTVISGLIGRELFMKKERKQFKKISKARNSFEKRDEALQCDIALEKLENRNRVLAWVASTLKSRQRYHDQINYHFTFQELNNRIKEIEIDLKDSYQKLDLCSSKMVLNNNLRGDNEKFVLKTMLVACMGTFSVIFPLPFIISYDISVFSFLLPFALASLTSCIYVIKRKFENKKIIRKYSDCNLEEYDFKKELEIENECMLNIREAEIKLQEYLSLLNDNQLKEEQSYEDHSQKVVSRPSVFEQTFEDGVLKEEKGFVKCLRR